jgi:hypothetical protein
VPARLWRAPVAGLLRFPPQCRPLICQ